MVLGHHTSDNFPFLDLVHSRYRTTFYQVNISCPLLVSLTNTNVCTSVNQPHDAPHCSRQALGRLLMLESPEDVVRFERFMAPMATVLQVHVCAVSFLSIEVAPLPYGWIDLCLLPLSLSPDCQGINAQLATGSSEAEHQLKVQDHCLPDGIHTPPIYRLTN